MIGKGRDSVLPPNLSTGQRAETLALEYLLEQGLKLKERNYRCRMGEVDLILQDGNGIVFVEVRYRASDRYGSALESVDTRKQARIVAAASHYLTAKRIDRPARFDVVAVSPQGGQLALQWVKDAFQTS